MSGTRAQAVVAQRPARASDIPALRSLFADAHLELACLPTDTRFVLADMRFRAERRQHAAAHPRASHDMLVVGGSVVGRALVDREGDAVRIVDISVSLGRRREGIAGAVVEALCAEADAAGRPVVATVWNGNHAALALLAGFHPIADEGGWVTLERSPR